MEDYQPKQSMMNQPMACAQPVALPQPMLDSVALRIDEALSELEIKVENLEMRLSRVLAPVNDKSIEEVGKNRSRLPSSILCRALDETANRIENITSHLNNLTDRMEI